MAPPKSQPDDAEYTDETEVESPHMTEDEYLARERESEARHEYADGEIVAMSGASYRHIRVVSNLVRALFQAVGDGPCQVNFNDLKVRIEAASAYRYPDVVVICGEPEIASESQGVVTNPTLIFEVLSKSTQMIDRSDKLREYTQIPSLRAYVLIEQALPYVEQYQRRAESENWLYTTAEDMQGALAVPSLEATLDLEAVYQGITFDPPSPPQSDTRPEDR